MADRQTRLIAELVDRVTGPARRISGAVGGMVRELRGVAGSSIGVGERIDAAMARNSRAIGDMRGRIVTAGLAMYGLARAVRAPVQAAMEFESAMADVRRVVDFSSENGLAEFRQELIGMSRELPFTVNQLAGMAAAAAQAGFSEDQIARVVRMAAQLGVAFDVGAERASTAIPELANSLGLTLDETERLADALNHLSNNSATTAGDLLDFMTRAGAQARQFGFTGEQASAFAAAMMSAGFSAEVAATSFRNMGRALTRGESATSRQINAFERLGLEASEVAAGMQRDAVGTTQDVLHRLSGLPAEVQAAVSSDLFGNEAAALAPLMTNADLLSHTLGMVGDQADYAGSMVAEFEVRNQTFAAQLQRLQNRFTELQIVIGEALIPAISALMDRMGPAITAVAEWVSANSELVAGLALATAGIAAFAASVTAVRFVGLLSAGVVLRTAIGIRTLALAFTTAAGAARVLTLAIVGTGIGAVLVGIAAAGTFIYNNWNGISEMFRAFGEAFTEATAPVADTLAPIIDRVSSLFGILQGVTGELQSASWTEWGTAAGEAVGNIVTAVIQAPERIRDGITSLYDAGVQMIQSLWDGARAKVEEFIAWLETLPARFLEAVRTNLGSAISIVTGAAEAIGAGTASPSSQVRRDARAGGGPMHINRDTWVGEEGPELVRVTRPATVLPNRALGGGGMTFSPTFNFSNVTAADAAMIEARVRKAIEEEIQQSLDGVFADIGTRIY